MKSAFSLQQRILLWLACSAIFFEAFDVSIVNLALPLIATDLHIPLATTQWVQTVYLLSFGGFLLLGGRLCDYAGSKSIFLTGMLIFGGASALAFFSHHILSLLPARAAQGIGAALAMPAGISLLSRHFPEGKSQQAAFAIFGAFAAVGFAGGLALGGMIASFFNWHWIFGINVPVIGLVLVTGYSYIPSPGKGGPEGKGSKKESRSNWGPEPGEPSEARSPLNGWTAFWLTATLLLFCYCIHESVDLGWKVLPLLLAAGISGVLLRRFDRRKAHPFFGAGVYSSPAAYRALGAFSLLGASFLPFVFLATLSLYDTMGWDILSTGLLLFPYSIGSALVSGFLLPLLFRRLGVLRVGLLAMGCLLAGDGLLAAGIYTHRLVFYLVALLLVNSVCIAIGYPAFTLLSLSGVRPAKQGIAAGLQSSLYTVGTGIGLSLTGLCLRSISHGAAGIPLLAGCGVVGLLCGAALWLLISKKYLPLQPDLK
jgi:MFS family permease